MRKLLSSVIVLVLPMFISACVVPFTSDPLPGPDKQAVGTWTGAAVGAGSGAVTGFQIWGSTTSGAWVGAGFGAIYGMLSGLGLDLIEEDQITQRMEESRLRELAWVQDMLAEHYLRRLELHPNRDIYPADWFFEADNTKLKPGAAALVREIAYYTRIRKPWSRIVVAAYSTASDPASDYAKFLNRRRSGAIAQGFVRAGMEPRRISTRALTLPKPVLIDPDDSHDRYRQAVEIIALD